ncbi:MAG: putative rane protein [Thermosipho sp. (in: thermotogales)]|nr:putative rane protein [Thermosipho sp. (in: thermotogales)]
MCWFWSPFGWFGGWFGSTIGLFVFVLIIYFGYKFIKASINHNESAFKILNEKLAKGEISEEEYLRKKEILTKNN